ncbi:hypothetical protein D3C71_1599870 [compost metagenome]
MTSDFMPKMADAVIARPNTKIKRYTFQSIALATGTANMATPTPNHPTCVKPSRKEGRYEPFSPNAYFASKCVERPVLAAICASAPV